MDVNTSTYGALLSKAEEAQAETPAQSTEATTTQEAVSTGTETTEQAAETTATTQEQEENVAQFTLGGEAEQATTATEATPAQPTFNWKDEIKKLDRKEVAKELGFTDFSLEIDEYLNKGGKAQDYLNAKAIDYNQVADEDLIKDNMRKQFPDFNKDEINRRFNRKYGTTEEMLEDEKEARADDLKADGYLLRKEKQTEQQTFKIPDTPILQKDEAYEQWKQQQEAQPVEMEQLKNFYLNHDATKSLNDSKRVAVSLGEGVQPFNFSIDSPEVLTRMYTDGGQTWQKLTSTKTGEPDVAKQQLIGLFSFDPHKYSQEIFNYGMQMGVKKKLVEEGQNAQRPQARIASIDTNNGQQNVNVGKFSDRARN